MNWEHLKAFVWLRWHLMLNQWKRAGRINGVLLMIVSIGAVATAVPVFFGSFALGSYAIPNAKPIYLMLAWDCLILAFCFFWSIGLLTELQRSDPLSLSKFMHLPVSVNGAFLINYLSSLAKLSLIVFVPAMLGFVLALIRVGGIIFVPLLLVLTAFLVMITGLTYQFQGWLASMMSNPRRRRTVIVVFTAVFIAGCQLPNLINIFGLSKFGGDTTLSTNYNNAVAQLDRDLQAGKISAEEVVQQKGDLSKDYLAKSEQSQREATASFETIARIANMVLPIGWLPAGVLYASEGNVIPSIFACLGMSAIGAGSLWRAYRTTLKQFQGDSSHEKSKPAPARSLQTEPVAKRAGGSMLEAQIPGCSEPVSVIAMGGLRSLLRSPEAKMMLLTPIIMTVIFGGMLFRQRGLLPEVFRPLVGIGAITFVLFGLLQLMVNQFAFDRDGFRVFVLSAASRRDILLGKNLSFAPLAAGLGGPLLLAAQILCPMRLDHFVAMFPQFLAMFLMFCLLTNLTSIYAPFYIAGGTLKPSNPKTSTVLLQLLMFLVLFPLTQGLTVLPLGIEQLCRLIGWIDATPLYLLLVLVEAVAIVFLYRLGLKWQGDLFQSREKKILEVVTNRGT